MRPPEALLYDSEASLRLVDSAIEELSASGAVVDQDTRGFLEHVMSQPGGFVELSRTLLRAYAETSRIVARLRESCGMVDSAGVDRLQHMDGRLREVSTATEMATKDILTGLTRTVGLVEKLDEARTLPDADRHRMLAAVREELGSVMDLLQFQDITAQQLGHTAALLSDMRRRINQIATMFQLPGVSFDGGQPVVGEYDPDGTTVSFEAGQPLVGPYDPDASAAVSNERQAVADEIFAVKGHRKTA